MTEAPDYADHPPSSQPGAVTIGAYLVAAYPVFFLAALYGEWFVAWSVLGHEPRPSIDDPKFIRGIGWADVAVTMGFLGLLPSGCAALVLTLSIAMDKDERGRRLAVLIGWLLACWAGTMLWLCWDPHRVAEWWID